MNTKIFQCMLLHVTQVALYGWFQLLLFEQSMSLSSVIINCCLQEKKSPSDFMIFSLRSCIFPQLYNLSMRINLWHYCSVVFQCQWHDCLTLYSSTKQTNMIRQISKVKWNLKQLKVIIDIRIILHTYWIAEIAALWWVLFCVHIELYLL